jgi:hypothetical protein
MGRQVRTSISLVVAAVATVSTPAARGFSRWSRKPPALDRYLTFARRHLQQFMLKRVARFSATQRPGKDPTSR